MIIEREIPPPVFLRHSPYRARIDYPTFSHYIEILSHYYLISRNLVCKTVEEYSIQLDSMIYLQARGVHLEFADAPYV